MPKLSRFSTSELVESLSHPDSWRRDTAHRLLFERQDAASVPVLQRLLRRREAAPHAGTQPDFAVVGRVLVLWSLDGLGALTDADLDVALRDSAPQVRRHAVRLASIRKSSLVTDSELRDWLAEQFARARQLAATPAAETAARVAAVELLSHWNFENVAPTLKGLLSATQSSPLQVAAVRALSSFSDPSLAEMLLDSYRSLGPEARVETMQTLSRSDLMPQLLAALEREQINYADLPAAQRAVLLRSTNADWKARAVVLAQKQQTTPRAKVVHDFQAALPLLKAEADRGTAVFRRVCSNCHRLEQQGADLGPPLETVQHRSAGELLVAILDPSREVLPNYFEYAVVLKDGSVATGAIAAESPAVITLKKAGAVQQSVARDNIDEIVATGKSIMPEGLEQQLTPQDLADLIAYLRRPH